jgi:hypothetical protein
MMKSIATAVAGLMFVMGVALVNSPKGSVNHSQLNHLKPSAGMLLSN